MSQGLVDRAIADLRENPKSIEIYGDDDISDLLESIPTKGILVPLVVRPDGTIISGHRRYRAARKLFEDGAVKSGVVPCLVVSIGGDLEEKDLIIAYNKQRKKTHYQLMKEADALEEIETARAKARQGSKLNMGEQAPLGKFLSNGDETGKARDSVARKIGYGMSGETFRKERGVWEAAKAGDRKAQELSGMLEKGEISVHDAYQQLRREEKAKDLRQRIEGIRSSQAPATEGLVFGDCREVLKTMQEGSVDLFLTDPPYSITRNIEVQRRTNPEKFSPALEEVAGDEGLRAFDVFESDVEYYALMKEWLVLAFRALRAGGHAVLFVDRLKVTKIVEIAQEAGFDARQPLFWLVKNPVPEAGRVRFMDAVHEMLWFTKPGGGATFNYTEGQHENYLIAPKVGGHERTLHPSQKPVEVLGWLVRYLSREGDLVVDPFAGSGSTLVAAKRLGRRAIGVEKNEFYYKVAAERLAILGRNGAT